MGRFEKEMAAGFAQSDLMAIMSDVEALLALREEYAGDDTVSTEHLARLAATISALNNHTAAWIENFNTVLEEAKQEGLSAAREQPSSTGDPVPPSAIICGNCGGIGRAAGLQCGTCNGTGRL